MTPTTPRSADSPGPTRFLIGTCGWSYPDWNGLFYPARRPRGFSPLRFLSRYFNAVEVNTSFYALPSAALCASWPEQTPSDFRFAFKLTRVFTHDEAHAAGPQDAAAFLEGLAPLRAAGRLGPLLLQFPQSFHFSEQSVERLRRLADWFSQMQRFIEVRHRSWSAPQALAALAQFGGYCNIDQPRLRDCLPPTAHVLGETGYVRLHGRNAANWFAAGRKPFERYDYLYSEEELRGWVQRLNEMCDAAREIYVFTNNHYRGQAAANALQLRAMLGNEPVAAPPELLTAYPALRPFAAAPPGEFLF